MNDYEGDGKYDEFIYDLPYFGTPAEFYNPRLFETEPLDCDYKQQPEDFHNKRIGSHHGCDKQHHNYYDCDHNIDNNHNNHNNNNNRDRHNKHKIKKSLNKKYMDSGQPYNQYMSGSTNDKNFIPHKPLDRDLNPHGYVSILPNKEKFNDNYDMSIHLCLKDLFIILIFLHILIVSILLSIGVYIISRPTNDRRQSVDIKQ
jgi:hypothetical protein